VGLLDSLIGAPRNRTAKQIQGQAGEDQALVYLEHNGLSLVERNFRCKGGEIDLIMQERGTLVFVEVRKRAGSGYGGAAASVTARKRARLITAAQIYLQRYRMPPPCRFDVVAIEGAAMDWLKNAIES
jgi:putative endonuclease